MEASQIKNVIVIGAGGNLNPLVISSLQSFGFRVSVLVRTASAVEPAPGTIVHRTDYSRRSLLDAFQGQDAVVNTITMPDLSDQLRIIDAAIEAGVKRFLPAEFGIDTSKAATVKIVPFLKVKPEVINYLRAKEGEISWTGLITGPFFDWGLRNGFFSFHVASRSASLHQPGHHSQRFTWSTLSRVAEAVSRSLLKSDSDVINRYVHLRSFTASQDEILESLRHATEVLDVKRGSEPWSWTVTDVNLEEMVQEAQESLLAGDTSKLGFMLSQAIYTTGGDYDFEGVTMNDQLGISSREELDDAVTIVVEEDSK